MGTPSDRAQILALEKGLNAGLNAKDSRKVMSYSAREGPFVFDVGPPRQHVGWRRGYRLIGRAEYGLA